MKIPALEIFLGLHPVPPEYQEDQEHQEYIRKLNEQREQAIAYYKVNKLENAAIYLKHR